MPEELYEEDVRVTERLQSTISQLRDEKKKKFVAERDAAWKDVAFKAAHKLGNPLDAIEAFLVSLRTRIETKNVKEAIDICEKMERSIEEAKTVISQFKSLTKFQEVNCKQINIREIIEQASKIARHKGINVEIKAPRKIPRVIADPDRMVEIFGELVANSLHWFDKDEKSIYVEIKKVHRNETPSNLDPSCEYLRITFADNGQGIPLSNKDRIFAPFYTTYPHGAGLGLTMVKWVIETHNGMIFEEGNHREGARFIIFLPIAKAGGRNA